MLILGYGIPYSHLIQEAQLLAELLISPKQECHFPLERIQPSRQVGCVLLVLGICIGKRFLQYLDLQR